MNVRRTLRVSPASGIQSENAHFGLMAGSRRGQPITGIMSETYQQIDFKEVADSQIF